MKLSDRDQSNTGQGASENNESRIRELAVAVDEAHRKLAEREALLAQALEQTETARTQYEQANGRVDTLRRRLSAMEEELISLQDQLQQRDERIAALERANTGISAPAPTPVDPIERLTAMGLTLESLDHPGARYKIIRPTTTIGRSASNDVAIDSNSVSRFHARIDIDAEGAFLVDLDSTNGTKVNDERITRQRIGDADMIAFGSTKFRFSISVPADVEARGMQETHVLLNDSAIFIPAPKSKPRTAQ